MRRTGFTILALALLVAAPAIGQERRAGAPSPSEPVFLWVAVSPTTTARMSGKIALKGLDPKGGPSTQGSNLNSARSNIYRAVGLTGGRAATLDLEVAEKTAGGQPLGDPIARTEVILEPISGGERRTARTDGRGRFAFEDLAPGGYELSWQAGGQRHYQQVWVEDAASARENGLEAVCRRKCAAEHTNAQGSLNADAYAACLRECMAAACPAPDGGGAAARQPCPEDRPACAPGEDITCRNGRWVCVGPATPSR